MHWRAPASVSRRRSFRSQVGNFVSQSFAVRRTPSHQTNQPARAFTGYRGRPCLMPFFVGKCLEAELPCLFYWETEISIAFPVSTLFDLMALLRAPPHSQQLNLVEVTQKEESFIHTSVQAKPTLIQPESNTGNLAVGAGRGSGWGTVVGLFQTKPTLLEGSQNKVASTRRIEDVNVVQRFWLRGGTVHCGFLPDCSFTIGFLHQNLKVF